MPIYKVTRLETTEVTLYVNAESEEAINDQLGLLLYDVDDDKQIVSFDENIEISTDHSGDTTIHKI